MSDLSESSIFDEVVSGSFQKRMKEGVSRTRSLLFTAAIFLAVVVAFNITLRARWYYYLDLLIVIGLNAAVVAGFIGLAFWARHKPFKALLTGIVMFLAVEAAGYVTGMNSIKQGPAIIVLITGLLFSGFRRAQVVGRSLTHQQDFSRRGA